MNTGRDPLAQYRSVWRTRAEKARNTWLPGTGPVEAAIEDGFRDGVKFAAEILEKDGHPELAMRIRMHPKQ